MCICDLTLLLDTMDLSFEADTFMRLKREPFRQFGSEIACQSLPRTDCIEEV